MTFSTKEINEISGTSDSRKEKKLFQTIFGVGEVYMFSVSLT